ncbi:MAG: hypothetical protein BJBARM5_0323 [Candidatus Parvarchaeum acidophilus ARMAN-5]|uniref:Uncharacterized protein n=1 Tax=Candidatus Parvarchaeum acidophilus ARMAN-5 TaxID=662762 RepID=D6GV22_PARA5|nr:MAG: hypothetical protein BJBARM5_0323 [Candidatus Parvarchaeum acidophilus ARMAN-5]
MEEYRLNPLDFSFSLLSDEKGGCKECIYNKDEIKSIEFKNGYVKVYEIKDRVQPSKYELTGQFFKKSNSHGYEEIIVENNKHSPNLRNYSAEDIENLLLIISNRLEEIKKYKIGDNFSITRYVDGHDYWDFVVLPIPRHITEKCYVCESIKNIGNREVFRTSNISGYIPFSPNTNEILKIAPLKHTSLDKLDNVVAFDLSNLLMKIIKNIKRELTISIIQSGNEHFEVSLLAGNVDPVEALGIKRINYSPEETAKKLREEIDYGK